MSELPRDTASKTWENLVKISGWNGPYFQVYIHSIGTSARGSLTTMSSLAKKSSPSAFHVFGCLPRVAACVLWQLYNLSVLYQWRLRCTKLWFSLNFRWQRRTCQWCTCGTSLRNILAMTNLEIKKIGNWNQYLQNNSVRKQNEGGSNPRRFDPVPQSRQIRFHVLPREQYDSPVKCLESYCYFIEDIGHIFSSISIFTAFSFVCKCLLVKSWLKVLLSCVYVSLKWWTLVKRRIKNDEIIRRVSRYTNY